MNTSLQFYYYHYRIEVKILLLTLKVLIGTAPSYSSKLLNIYESAEIIQPDALSTAEVWLSEVITELSIDLSIHIPTVQCSL